jgi:type VI secretion system protein ImpL
MLTKADLIRGFEPFFANLTTQAREQVWGVTFPLDKPADAEAVGREISALAAQLEKRMVPRLEDEERLPARADIFRFPAQLETLSGPVKLLIDTIFGESRYEDSPWLRGVYLTSATQEGAPIDRLTAALSSSFGIPPQRSTAGPRIERRSFFLNNLLTEVIFREAGLGTFDPAALRRRAWIWRGAAALCAAVAIVLSGAFLFSYFDNRQVIAAQAEQFQGLQTPLAAIAASPSSVKQPDIEVPLAAAGAVESARIEPPGGVRDMLGPSAAAEIALAQRALYDRTLRNLLEPRMIALLEATMWRHVRDPEFMFGALKTYRMMTGLSQMDPDFAKAWWVNALPGYAPFPPFPTADAERHETAAIQAMVVHDKYVTPDANLVAEALKTVCAVPLPVRGYKALLADPAVASLKEWIPANFAGPNGAKVLTRRSGKTLRIGLPGAFTYDGFHGPILDRLQDVAAQAALDRAVYAGGCSENSETSVAALSRDILKLYYDDYIAKWDGFLHDVKLAPLTDLRVASQNLKDLSSADSAVKRLVTAVVRETELTRSDEAPVDSKTQAKATSTIFSKLGKLGKIAKTGIKLLPRAGGADEIDETGSVVAAHFKPLKGAVAEVDGQPPALDAAVVALTALSNVLETVNASPNPQEAIKKQGGLAELTGAVARQAQILPDPIDDWMAGIAGDTSGLTEKAVTSELNAIWRSDVLPFCQAALTNRYPFDPGSTIDVNVQDFTRLFGPGGLIDGFTNNNLLPYIDTTAEPWKWRADFNGDASTLAAFEKARHIRDGLFPGGQGPIMNFTLEPKDLSPTVSRATLNIDGQLLNYYNNATRPQPMTWPGKDGTGVVSLSFQPIDGSPEVVVNETGSWAWLRMLRGGHFAKTPLPDAYSLRLGANNYYVDFELRAASVENPYTLEMFKGFACPPNI